MGESADGEPPEQAGVDDADIDMGEADFFSYYWSCWPVVEPSHVDEQIEGCVTE